MEYIKNAIELGGENIERSSQSIQERQKEEIDLVVSFTFTRHCSTYIYTFDVSDHSQFLLLLFFLFAWMDQLSNTVRWPTEQGKKSDGPINQWHTLLPYSQRNGEGDPRGSFFRLLVGSSIKNKTKNVEPYKIEFGQGKVGYCVNKWKPPSIKWSRPIENWRRPRTRAVLLKLAASNEIEMVFFNWFHFSFFFNAFTKKKKNKPKKQDISRETYGLVLSFRSSFA